MQKGKTAFVPDSSSEARQKDTWETETLTLPAAVKKRENIQQPLSKQCWRDCFSEKYKVLMSFKRSICVNV